MVVVLLESVAVGFLHMISFIFDILTRIPFYFIQEPRTALELSNRTKAVNCTDHPAGPYKCVEEVELTTTPDEECSTLDELFQKAVTKFPDAECLGWRESEITEPEERRTTNDLTQNRSGEYTWLTYTEVAKQVSLIGKGLQELGVKLRDNVLLFGETQASWLMAAEACFRQNFVVVLVHSVLGDEALVNAANSTEAVCAIITAKYLTSFSELISVMPTVKHVIYIENQGVNSEINRESELLASAYKEITLKSMTELLRESTSREGSLGESSALPNDVAVIMYTSGSTGSPKGVLLTHINLLSSCSSIVAKTDLSAADTYVAYLPQAHILELTAELSCLYTGARIGFASPSTLLKAKDASTACDLLALKPTVMTSVPEYLNKIYKTIGEQVKESTLIWRILFRFSISYKRKWLYRGSNTPLLNAFIMSSIRYQFGNHLRLVTCGGASLNPRTQEFLRLCLCCPVIQGYGMTETAGAATIVDQDDLSSGHAGAPVSCAYIKLVNWEEGGYSSADMPPRGEIWVGGPSVGIGYFKDLNRTEESFHQRGNLRWFATGDIGRLREDGTLVIVDRKRDVVKLPAGEFVSLSKIEAVLRLSPLVDNACVVSEVDQPYLAALVVPNPVHVHLLAQRLGVISSDWSILCNSKLVTEAVMEDIRLQAELNNLYSYEVPRRIRLVEDRWLTQNHFITDSQKIRRSQILSYYREFINSLFPSRRRSKLAATFDDTP